MNIWQRHLPLSYKIFMLIAEPRVSRLIQFGVYLCMATAGIYTLFAPPKSFEDIVEPVFIYIMGAFILSGAIFAFVGVLPGIWWLERVGLIALMTGISIYAVIVISLGSSPVGVAVVLAFDLTFALRWRDIRQYQLAPREG